jgi:copper(I)-binding protein
MNWPERGKIMQMPTVLRIAGRAAAAAVLLLLAGCTPVMPMTQPMGDASMPAMEEAAALPTPEPGKVTVANVRARPAPLENGNGAAYLLVLNGLDVPVRLASAESTVAGAIELHETIDDNGVMKMEPHPEGFEVPAGGVLELKPGGKHVMLLGLAAPLVAGDSFELTFNFEGADPISVTVPVVEMQAAMPAMDHGQAESGAMPMGTETPNP